MTYGSVTGYPFNDDKAAGYGPEPVPARLPRVEEAVYQVWTHGLTGWAMESGGRFTVHGSSRAHTDEDAREDAIEYARTVAGNGAHVRVERIATELIFDSEEDK